MKGDLFIVSKGNTRIQLTDKMSALHLVSTLAALECTEPITSSKISGCKDYGDVFYNKVVNYKLKICAVKGNTDLIVKRIICELERCFIRHYAGNGHLLNNVPKSFMSI